MSSLLDLKLSPSKELGGVSPELVATTATLKSIVEHEKWLGVGNIRNSRGHPSKFSGIKWRNALHDLPYLKYILLKPYSIKC
jgi:hypothetical protein